MFETYAEECGHLAVQEVYPITSEGRLVETIKRRRRHKRMVVWCQPFLSPLQVHNVYLFLPYSFLDNRKGEIEQDRTGYIPRNIHIHSNSTAASV